MHDDAVEIDNRPDRLQRPRPPSGHLRVEVLGDFRDERSGDFHVVQVLYDLLNVPRGHSLGVQGQNLFIEARHAPLVLADQLRLESPVPIAWRGNREFAQIALDGFLRTPIATVGRALGWVRRWWTGCDVSRRDSKRLRGGVGAGQRSAAQVDIHLAVEHPLQGALHHQPHQTVEVLSRLRLTGDFTC